MTLRSLLYPFLILILMSLSSCTFTPRIPEAIPVATSPAASTSLQKRCACPVKRANPVAKRVVKKPQVVSAVNRRPTRAYQIKPAVVRNSNQNGANVFLASYSTIQRSAFGPPLSYAVSTNNSVLAKQLLDNGANIEALDPMQLTPLGLAIIEKSPHMADLLLQRGANISADVPPYGQPLVAAINVNSPEVVKVLLKHGVNKDASKFHWRRPLDIAREKGNPAIISLLEKSNASSANDDFKRENAERKLYERMSHSNSL